MISRYLPRYDWQRKLVAELSFDVGLADSPLRSTDQQLGVRELLRSVGVMVYALLNPPRLVLTM